MISYPITDSHLPFADYIKRCHALIEARRKDLHQSGTLPQRIIDANTPFAYDPPNAPKNGKKYQYGALLIHGLFDSPFSLKDVGAYLDSKGIISRAILLPGHGTVPNDLLHVSYHDWIQAVRYGVESLREVAKNVYLVGYSTGAALSIYHAMQDTEIAGIIMLSPAIRLKTMVGFVVSSHYLMKWVSGQTDWIYQGSEIDYAKYKSIPFKPVHELGKLTDVINELNEYHPLTCPVFVIVSWEDETISSQKAIHYFCKTTNPLSQMLLYSSIDQHHSDPRILTRKARFPELNIEHLSHVGLPFTPHNTHYGQHGDYMRASHIHASDTQYGAYNRLQEEIYYVLHQLSLMKNKRLDLTYNPDFDYMAEKITDFMFNTSLRDK